MSEASSRCKLLAWLSMYPRGGRVGSLALATHHRTSGSAGTARGPRALDLAGALHAMWRAARRRGRERGFDPDQSVVHDSQQQRVQSRQRGLEWIRVPRNVSCVAREGRCPTASNTAGGGSMAASEMGFSCSSPT